MGGASSADASVSERRNSISQRTLRGAPFTLPRAGDILSATALLGYCVLLPENVCVMPVAMCVLSFDGGTWKTALSTMRAHSLFAVLVALFWLPYHL